MTSFREKYEMAKLGYVYENIDTFLTKETHEETKKQVKKFLELLLINNGEMTF